MSELPFIACLCPTYCRPELLARSIEMFDAQDYPAERRHLVILDDSPGLKVGLDDRRGPSWSRFIRTRRADSLPEKFNEIARQFAMQFKPDAFAVWEDDDEYRPWHLSAHASALERNEFSKPSRVFSDYADPPRLGEEGAAGRFHASIAFRRELFERIGGWPETKRADFDQQMLGRLRDEARGIGDPCEFYPPSYVFRWHTDHYHGQHTMQGPADEGWYDRLARR
jgi:hypothetical protein